jgi:hypothetical protein
MTLLLEGEHMRYEIDNRYSWLVLRKIRPIWAWERELNWSMAETGNEHCMAVWQQSTLGM